MLLNLAMDFGIWWDWISDIIIEDKAAIENYAWACWTKIREVINKKTTVEQLQLDEFDDEEEEEDFNLGDYDMLEDRRTL